MSHRESLSPGSQEPPVCLPDWQRRAVLVVDMVESVRLMQTHEADVIGRWRRFVDEVRCRLLPAHGGRMVKSLGDGLLLAFETAAQAVLVAFRLHVAIDDGNRHRGADALILLRIGLHVADLVVDELDIYGQGVNIAARIASLGQPGDTLLSAAARDQVVDGLHADLEDLGERFVKHIDGPLRVFRALPPGAVSNRAALMERMPHAPDLRPTLAVVPFSRVCVDASYDALGHAMADDISAAMAKHAGLRVLSRASTARLRDTELDPMGLWRLVGASFLLTGRYYVMGERVRLSVELCSLPAAEILWTGTATATADALFAGHDDLVPHVVAQVGQCILAHELMRVRSLPMNTLASYTLYLGANGLMNSLQASDFKRAREVLDHLVERYPRQAAPYAMLARWHVFKSVQGWSENRDTESRLALEEADRALDIDPRQAMALASAGLVRMNYHNDTEAARQLYEAAIEADPQEAHAWAWLTAVHSFTGAHERACECSERAIALSPLDPNRYLFESWAAMSSLGAGRFDDAVVHAQTSVRLHALHAPSVRLLVGALWLSGRKQQAIAVVPRYLELRPEARAGRPHPHLAGHQPVWSGQFNEALVQAGVPS